MLSSFVRGKELHLLGGDGIGNDPSTMYFICTETSLTCLVLTSASSGRLCAHMKCCFSATLCHLQNFVWRLEHPKLCCYVTKRSPWKECLHWSPEGHRKSHRLHKQVPKVIIKKEHWGILFFFLSISHYPLTVRKYLHSFLYCIIWVSSHNLCLGQMPWTWIKKRRVWSLISLWVLSENIW